MQEKHARAATELLRRAEMQEKRGARGHRVILGLERFGGRRHRRASDALEQRREEQKKRYESSTPAVAMVQ
jgi:hypothetical protein